MPKKKSPTRRKPIKQQKLGAITITIQEVDKPPYSFVTVMRRNGKRISEKYFKIKAEAENRFQLWTTQATNHGTEAATKIDDSEQRAILDFHAATKDWQVKPTVAEALKQFIADHARKGVGLTVSEAVEKQRLEMERRGLSKKHRDNTRVRLDRFTKDFGARRLNSISTDELKVWIHDLGLSITSQKNFKLAINPLFREAIERGELQRNPLVFKLPKDRSKRPPAIFKPSDVTKILSTAPDTIRPALAIQCFAGLRRAEVLRLQWDCVNLLENHIEVTAGTAKTASRRLVTMTPNLKAWLQPLAKSSGPVAPLPDKYRFDLDRHLSSIGATWKDNGCRHSFISYLIAQKDNAALVAKEAGNSEAIIHKHYKALATKTEAAQYFAIMPDKGKKVIKLPTKSA